MKRNTKKGFTLVELLVVIAIIGLLATVAFLSLNRARSKARDAKRISDIRQVQSALELYYNDQLTPHYPVAASSAGVTLSSAVLGSIYLADVPDAPSPADNPTGSTDCTAGNTYRYASLDGTAVPCTDTADTECGASYNMTFCLGGATGGVDGGCNIANPTGITTGACLAGS